MIKFLIGQTQQLSDVLQTFYNLINIRFIIKRFVVSHLQILSFLERNIFIFRIIFKGGNRSVTLVYIAFLINNNHIILYSVCQFAFVFIDASEESFNCCQLFLIYQTAYILVLFQLFKVPCLFQLCQLVFLCQLVSLIEVKSGGWFYSDAIVAAIIFRCLI